MRGADGAGGSGTRSSSRRGLGRTAKRVIVATTGTTLLGVGFVMLVLPGPGLLVITGGLALLATEFSWAERRLQQARAYAGKAATAARRRRRRSSGDVVVDLHEPDVSIDEAPISDVMGAQEAAG